MELIIAGIAAKYPILLTIASIMGMARMFLKPTIAFAHTIVALTETEKDNLILKRAEESKIFKGILFVLDYVFSLKLQAPVVKK